MVVRSARQEQIKERKRPIPEVRRQRLSHVLGALAALGAAITPWQDFGRARPTKKFEATTDVWDEPNLEGDIAQQVGSMDRQTTQNVQRFVDYLRSLIQRHLEDINETDRSSSFDTVMEEAGVGPYTEFMITLRDILQDDKILRQRLDQMLTAASIDVTSQDKDHIIEQMQQIKFTADYTDKRLATLISHPELGDLVEITRSSTTGSSSEGIGVRFFGSKVTATEAGQEGDYPFRGSVGDSYGTIIGEDYGEAGDKTQQDILESLVYEFLPGDN